MMSRAPLITNCLLSRELEATEVFGGVDETHPAVKYLFRTAAEYYVGGKLEAINRLAHYDFLDLRCEPFSHILEQSLRGEGVIN